MTRLQFRRWYGFALRMAERGLHAGRMPRKSIKFVRDCVEELFYDIFRQDDWYTKNTGKGMIERIKDWDHNDHDGIERGSTLYCVGDKVSILLQERNPFRWNGTDKQFEAWDEKWGARVRCCIRAGLDMASAPSAGVMGFTVGDLRRMYPHGIPSWVFEDLRSAKSKKPVDLNSKRIRDKEGVWL
jgi:hypothetical protein